MPARPTARSAVFAGTSTKLYNLNNTDLHLDRRLQVGRQLLGTAGLRSMAVRAVRQLRVRGPDQHRAVQVFDLTASSAFADLGGIPPPARYIAVVGRFLVLSGLGSGTPYRIQWSGLNAITTWTPGTNQSDYQDFPDGGIVRGVAGGEYGVVFQDASIRRMTYAPGSPVIFQIDRITEEKGIFAPSRWCAPATGCSTSAPRRLPGDRAGRLSAGDRQGARRPHVLRRRRHRQPAALHRRLRSQGQPRLLGLQVARGASGLFDKMLCYD